ncbi:MAG: hypothetical protein A2Y25_04545 [Candidatus Melainabacteria bacterium GWF2_37_15]|nr:MAG: hypothetical protein A2Y25_04545 [Candidatus Melainabacteria bacterium GWF2_37_15]
MATKTKNNDEVKSKIDSSLKNEVELILDNLGLSHSEAIRIFYKQIRLLKKIPFELKIPNEETLKAIHDADNDVNMTECESAEDLFNKLGI